MPKGIFLDEKYAYLSAILLSANNGINYAKLDDEDLLEVLSNQLILIHNPKATVGLPKGMLDAKTEFEIAIHEEGYTIISVKGINAKLEARELE